MTNIMFSNRPGSCEPASRHAKPVLVRFWPLVCVTIAVGLSGCTGEPERKAVAESWQRIDQQGGIVDNGVDNGIDNGVDDGIDVRHHCVFDRRTKLLWEVKQSRNGAHRFDATYSWYSDDPTQHMSEPGTQDGGQCDLDRCDTQALVTALNSSGLCGHRDWRMPQREELLTLGDYRLIESGNVLDPEFFPHALPEEYWSASTFRLYPQSAWVVSASNGLDRGERKTEARPARLVRGEIFNPRKPPDAK